MKTFRILILSLALLIASSIAFSPSDSFADLVQILTNQLAGTVTYPGGTLTLSSGSITEQVTGGNPAFVVTDGTIQARIWAVNGDRVYIGSQSNHNVSFQANNSVKFTLIPSTGDLQSDATNGGNLVLQVAGKNFQLKGGGAAAKAGTFTCNGVTGVTISTTAAATSMAIAFAPNTISGTAGIGSPFVSAISAGTSFSVKCSIAGETSTYNWAMLNVN